MEQPAVKPRYGVLDVSDWPVEAPEPTGDDPKDWLVAPDGTQWLFKPREEKDGWSQGEDWAEKVVAELATELGVPAARVELAVRRGVHGSLSLKITPDGFSLQPGEVLIAEEIPSYEPRTRERTGHNLDVIRRVLAGVGPPPGSPGVGDLDAFDVFSGYLVLDALIANRDRHEQNWAVLLRTTGAESALAPSYDHATSLGFNFRDSRRKAFLSDPSGGQLTAWALKGTAHRFEAKPDGKRLTLVELAREALSRCSTRAASHWLDRVQDLDLQLFRRTVERTPEMSDLARTFAVAVVETNRRRLLDGD